MIIIIFIHIIKPHDLEKKLFGLNDNKPSEDSKKCFF